jgi:hypothetical protein
MPLRYVHLPAVVAGGMKKLTEWRRSRLSSRRPGRSTKFNALLAVALALPTMITICWSEGNVAVASGTANTAIAGARVSATGRLLYWFNGYGGAPTVTHSAGSGIYELNFPGAPILNGNNVLEVTPDTPSAACTAVNADYANTGAATAVVVETKACTNVFADQGFYLSVFGTGA